MGLLKDAPPIFYTVPNNTTFELVLVLKDSESNMRFVPDLPITLEFSLCYERESIDKDYVDVTDQDILQCRSGNTFRANEEQGTFLFRVSQNSNNTKKAAKREICDHQGRSFVIRIRLCSTTIIAELIYTSPFFVKARRGDTRIKKRAADSDIDSPSRTGHPPSCKFILILHDRIISDLYHSLL